MLQWTPGQNKREIFIIGRLKYIELLVCGCRYELRVEVPLDGSEGTGLILLHAEGPAGVDDQNISLPPILANHHCGSRGVVN
jgi:hypothetical protein